jgi:hypothetical protein
MNILLLLSIRENSTFNFNYFSGGLPEALRLAVFTDEHFNHIGDATMLAICRFT